MMTNEKIRQDFEDWYNSTHREPIRSADRRTDGDYRLGISGLWTAYQAGRAAERAKIREKLESAEVKKAVGQSILGAPVSAENIFEKAKAAITKILEVI